MGSFEACGLSFWATWLSRYSSSLSLRPCWLEVANVGAEAATDITLSMVLCSHKGYGHLRRTSVYFYALDGRLRRSIWLLLVDGSKTSCPQHSLDTMPLCVALPDRELEHPIARGVLPACHFDFHLPTDLTNLNKAPKPLGRRSPYPLAS